MSTLEEITIYRDKRGDRSCPSCKKKDIELQPAVVKHNRTELHIKGYCPDCGCDFVFVYGLQIGDIIIKH